MHFYIETHTHKIFSNLIEAKESFSDLIELKTSKWEIGKKEDNKSHSITKITNIDSGYQIIHYYIDTDQFSIEPF